MSLKKNDEVYDFLADQCEAGLITLEQYNAMKKKLGNMPSAEEMDEPSGEEQNDIDWAEDCERSKREAFESSRGTSNK